MSVSFIESGSFWNKYNEVIRWVILAHCFPRKATEVVLWAEQCDDRTVLWEHLISSTRGAKQHRTVPWYLACAVSGKIATGPTLIAKMPPECVCATSPVPDHETTRECPSFYVYINTHSISVHSCVQMCEPHCVSFTHTNQYLLIDSHNPQEHKLGLIRLELNLACPRAALVIPFINKLPRRGIQIRQK